jgi:soluble lytic murein transglycosylase-like protein
MKRGVVFALVKRHLDPRLGLCALALVVGLAWIHTNAPIPEQRVMPFAKPQLGQYAYNVEVARLGARISAAFGINRVKAEEFSYWLIEASERQRISVDVLASLVLTESSFRKNVRSPVGAVGPAQVRPDYWAAFCGQDHLNDPEQNVYCGAQVLGHLLERCDGDLACALGSYNVGPNARKGRAAARYVAKIDLHLERLEQLVL